MRLIQAIIHQFSIRTGSSLPASGWLASSAEQWIRHFNNHHRHRLDRRVLHTSTLRADFQRDVRRDAFARYSLAHFRVHIAVCFGAVDFDGLVSPTSMPGIRGIDAGD